MDLSQFKTAEQSLAEQLDGDPEFRAYWERTALARAVALSVLRYRTAHNLSQSALGRRLGMSQPQVSRLEDGEHNPSMETLLKLSARLGLKFDIQVRPVAASVDAAAQAGEPSESPGGAEVVVAAVAA